jgi:hypothetical protein
MRERDKSETRHSKVEIRKTKNENRKRTERVSSFGFRISSILFASVFICVHQWLLPPSIFAQEAVQEVVANLAAGRVVIYVAKDGIVIGANENRLEAESRTPVFVPLSSKRVAVLLGAVEWLMPGTGRPPMRLDREFPRLIGLATYQPRLQQEQSSDLEPFGLAMLDPLRRAAQQLTRKMELGPEEPILEMLLVGYEEQYGPEVWLLKYRTVQEPLRGDYWRTRVLRPSYDQLYPPEKDQPRTLVEVRYPPEDAGPSLLELLQQSDPRLTPLRTSNAQAVRAAEKLTRGESNKGLLDDAVVFLRASLDAVAQPDTAQGIAVIKETTGFEWILAPPQALQKAEEADSKPREPGAPSLRKKPPQ